MNVMGMTTSDREMGFEGLLFERSIVWTHIDESDENLRIGEMSFMPSYFMVSIVHEVNRTH